MPVSDPTQRFSSRVNDYVLYRPGYPAQILELLKSECGMTSESVVADIASGTGIFTRMLLENGNRVFGVEPNDDMRKAGERVLGSYSKFTSVAGMAEATTLPDHSLDFVTAAQAAHWFDRDRARKEFMRILRTGETPAARGWTVLIWNERKTDTTTFLRAYEKLLLDFGTDYEAVRHERTTDAIGEFFAKSPYRKRVFSMKQQFDFDGLRGRLLSSSYSPAAGHPNHEPMLRELRRIFDACQENGRVSFDYDTRVYYGQL
jgi:ubiquinone/menaquinone biosynthesis C-methylase UbiE